MDLHELARRLFTDSNDGGVVACEILTRFGSAALDKTYDHGIRIKMLKPLETYRDHSTTLRRLALDVDAWPVPPAGLFIVEERTMLIRRMSPMTIAHEFGHAIDCMLGGGIYRSSIDTRLQRAYRQAIRWITPYAATRIDEYFAEGLRAYVEANDRTSPWPRATRERLRLYDPALFAYVEELFANELTAPPIKSAPS
jgi:hypothetical protein